MANNFADESSDEESYPYSLNSNILQGYSFEPSKKSNSTKHDRCANESMKKIEKAAAHTPTRLGSQFWCKCGKCIALQAPNTEKDCICCFELNALNKFGARAQCFVFNSEFNDVCMNTSVLKNVLICLNTIRMDNWSINPPTNRQEHFQYALYTKYIRKIMS